MAQSADAAEYTNCISAEGYDSPNICPGYDTKPSQPSRLGLQNIRTASLLRGMTLPNKCFGYDTKQSDDEASVMFEL